jgi:hypothetical protein
MPSELGIRRCTPKTNGVRSARYVATVVNQGEDSYEQANGGYEQDQNAVAERCAALRA